MNKISKNILFSTTLALTVALSATFVAKAAYNKNDQVKTVTIEQKENKVKVDKMLVDVENDITSNFNIDKFKYTKLDLKDMPKFAQGQIDKFSDLDFCQSVAKVLNYEFKFIPEGSLKPTILVNNKEFIFSYKDKDGVNFIKKYNFENGNWIKVSDESKKGKHIVFEQYN